MVKPAQETPPLVSISLSSAAKQIQFLKTLKPLRFTGQLVFTSSKEQPWFFYLYQGHIMYATGGNHPVRRWQRNLAAHCSQIVAYSSAMQRDLAFLKPKQLTAYWEYQLLCLWVAQQKITPEQASNMIHSVITEVLFDVAQAMRVIYQINADNTLSPELTLIDVHEAIAEVQELWQVWRNAKIGDHSPDKAPVIKEPEKLRKRTSAEVYQTLSKLLNGQHTLRDIAMQMKQDVVQVTRSLMPYIQLGLVELISIPDLPPLFDAGVPKKLSASTDPTVPLVACVDDSPLVCKTMESLLTAAGYRFIGVEDGVRAFAMLLGNKPDLIFLDLVMPNTNGYEICSQLRKLPYFRNTPILILTGNDGIVDRVRAKLVGASDFLSKPIDAGKVLSVIRKHLKQGAQGLNVEG